MSHAAPPGPPTVSPQLARAAGVVLAAGAALCFVLALLVLRAFRAALPDGLALALVAAPLLAGVALLAARRLRPERRVLAAVITIFVAGALYATDLILALTAGPAGPREDSALAAARARGAPFDERSHAAVVDSVAAVRGAAFPAGVLSLVQRRAPADAPPLLPLGGVADRPHVLCRESGVYPVYQSDERGFNNPRGLWALDSLQVVALGDSFTHGFCVPPESAYVALVRRRYPATLNLGIVGNGPLAELAAVREYLPRYRPRTVLWFFYEGNDLSDFEVEKVDAMLPRYRQDGFRQGLAERQPEVDSLLAAAYRASRATAPTADARPERAPRPGGLRRRVRAAVLQTLQWVTLGHLGQSFAVPLREGVGLRARADLAGAAGLAGPCCDLAGFEDVLRRANGAVSSWGGRVYFVYIPAYDRYSPPHIRQKETRQRDRVLAAARRVGLTVIDLDPAFRASGDPHALFYHPNSHLNVAGQLVVADAVLRALERR